jgi:K+-sensing histidine kinase KdpD
LFLNFSRLEDHQKSNERGTGLGLSICKSLLEKMGGNVTVESEGIGHGTTFIMQMHAKCKVLPNAVPISSEDKNGKKRLGIAKRFMRS